MNPTHIGIPTSIWVVLEHGNGTPTLVSTLGSEFVDQFKDAIKKKYARRLASYDASDLTLFTADGMTEIATDDTMGELKEKLEYKDNGKQRALVVRVDTEKLLIIKSGNDAVGVKSFLSNILVEVTKALARNINSLYLKNPAKKSRLDDLSMQLQSLRNARMEDGCIVSGKNLLLPYPQDKVQKLFVRKCYEDVFGLFSDQVKNGTESFAISGTPGIGKSLFFVYILFKILKKQSGWKPKRVVYNTNTSLKCFDLECCAVTRISQFDAEGLVREPETFYIVDGQTTPMSSSCITLFISSPRSQQYKEFVKQKMAKEWYFPVWTLEELQSCQSQCYPELSIEILIERYQVYGGVARMVFYSDFSIILPNIMEEALADVDAVMGVRSIGIPTKIFATTHTLLHIIVSNDRLYQFTHVDIASKYVGEKLWELHYAQMITNLKEMFGGSPNVISGHLFEIYGHRIFSKGDMTLNCRDLQDDSISDFVLERLDGPPITFGRNNLPESLLTSYYEASDDASFPAIDSLSLQGMFQFTVAQEHPIRGAQILKRLCALYTDPKIYFVVPPHRFAKFKIQKFLLTQGNSTVEDIPELKQFVLELPV